ncbi:ABC transporter substrate-binding protein [Paenibacillus sp. 32O-W]|uniref:ABC transporter substrate-binding protein n=1 Tax=Paenibacillus sp. 32O-W TaxID=1695218 RepID=UPI0007216A4F|nr:extracellular solute-binding protein [Paenibacillus sp. 32O-W]ALS28634.1 ABC transporter substrate-binding protein [Paenibacillus sp. 32O-W]
MNKFITACFLALLLAVAGCSPGLGRDSSARNEARAEPVLKVLYGTAETGSEAVIDAIRKYEQLSGLKVEISMLTYDHLHGKVMSELSRRSGEYDLIALDSSWMPKVIHHLEPLSGYMRASKHPEAVKLDDFVPEVFLDAAVFDPGAPHRQPPDMTSIDLEKLTSAGFDVWSLPVHVNVLMGSYRRDLFRDPDERQAFRARFGRELRVPDTIDDYLDIARFFTRDTDGDGKSDFYGTTLMAARNESNFIEFQSLLAAYGGQVLDDNMKPAFHSEAGIRALETYGSWINRYQVAPPDSLSYTWEEAGLVFNSGQAAMGMFYYDMGISPKIRSAEIGYFVVPGVLTAGKIRREPLIASWGLSVNKYSAHKQEAYELAEYVTSPDVQRQALRFRHHVTRQSAFAEARSLILRSDRDYYKVLRDSLGIGVGRPRIVNYNQVSDAVQSAVHEYLIGMKDAETALTDAAVLAGGLLKQAGY